MSDLREVLQENSYLRQKQLIFADCDRYQRARVSTLLSIAAAVAGADYDARGLTYEKLYETVSYTHLTLPTICSV